MTFPRLPRWSNRRIEIIVGGTSPAWIYSAGVTPVSFTNASGATKTMPNPWDTVFQAKWGELLSALGTAFDGDPTVAYITMSGMGYSTETIMPA